MSGLGRETFLTYRGMRYFKLAAGLVGAMLLLAWVVPARYGLAYGGTPLGYLLGIVSAGLALTQIWYGIRKRRPPRVEDRRRADRRRHVAARGQASGMDDERRRVERRQPGRRLGWRQGGTLFGWLSAHAYFGGALLVTASLHSGFHFAWNLHTLVYLLLLLMVASGVWGALAYLRYPALLSGNSPSLAADERWARIAEVDRALHAGKAGLPADLSAVVTQSLGDDPLAAGMWRQALGAPPRFRNARALETVQDFVRRLEADDHATQARELYGLLLKKQHLLTRMAEESRLYARMRVWRIVHGPVAVAFVALLAAHVATMLVFW